MGIRKILVVFNKGPYGSVSSVEATRLATGVTAADIVTSALFLDDGVYALVKDQQPALIGIEPIVRSIEFLVANGIKIHVLGESLISRGIPVDRLRGASDLRIIDKTEMASMMAQNDAVISI